jgi:hypothetical protein
MEMDDSIFIDSAVALERNCRFTVQTADGDEIKRYLQGILNEHHETAYPLMEVPKSKKYAGWTSAW